MKHNKIITYDENHNILHIFCKLNALFHNSNGPATLYYHFNGNIRARHFFIKNVGHNLKSPGLIKFNILGNPIVAAYWFNNKSLNNINSKKEFKQYIKLQNIS